MVVNGTGFSPNSYHSLSSLSLFEKLCTGFMAARLEKSETESLPASGM